MWYPPNKDLIAAKIVTHIVDPDQFGMSGIVNWRDKEAMERGLLSIPFYALVRDNDPAGFKKIADRFSEAIKLGKSGPELGRIGRRRPTGRRRGFPTAGPNRPTSRCLWSGRRPLAWS